MSIIPSGDLALLRAEGHTSSVYASFLKPDTLWWAQVNSGALSRGDTVIPWDGGGSGGGGDWSAVADFQTVWVGTTPGGNEIGRVRIRSTSTGDAGVTGTLTVTSNAIPWVDDLYLTFKHNYEFWPMYPYIDPATEVFYKDGNLAYDNNNLTPNPVVIVEFSQRAGFIKDGELTFWVDASDSYAVASGATISSYALTVYPMTGLTVTFSAVTGIGRIQATSLAQEYFWCRFVVTDSNGRDQVGFRCIFAHDPDPTGSTYPHTDFMVNQLNGAWDRGGWYTQIPIHDNGSLNDIPDHTFAVLWAENAWGIGNNVATIVRDDIKTFVNPKFSYTVTPNGANCDIDLTFVAGVLGNGQPVPDPTGMSLDLSVNGGVPVPITDNSSGGIITLNHTFVAEPCSGTLLAEDIGNTRTILAGTYQAGEQITETGEWPSIMKAFPQTLLVGYVRRENMTFSTAPQGGTGQNTLEITTIDDMMRNQYMFSISLAARPSPTKWYEYASWLTIGRAVHHIWRWHSTLFRIANVKGLMDNTDGRAYAEFENGTLYSMPDTMARQHGIRAHVVCNKKGDVCLVQDAQLLVDADRAALDVIANVTPEDRSGEIGILRDPEDRIALVYASGLAFAGAFSGPDNDPDVSPYCAMAPGHVPAGGGEGTIDLERQVLTSQNQLNALAGRVYAQENNLYPEIRIRYHGNYLEYLDFYPAEFWEIDLGTGDTIKELAIPDLNLILRSVAARVDVDQVGGTIRADVTFEPEMDGFAGIATDCPAGPTDLGGDPPPVPPPAELPGAIITASSVDYLSAGSSTWVQRTTEGTQDIVQDPFWRTRQATTDPSDSILLKCGVGHVKRSINGGVAWSDITPGTDPPNDAGDAVAPTKTSVTYFRLDGSFITQSEFAVTARWQNATGDWRSWIAFTDDDGTSWSWAYLGEAPSGCTNPGTIYSFSSVAGGGAGVGPGPATASNGIFEISSGKFVMTYSSSTAPSGAKLRAFTMAGDVPTFGAEVGVTDDGGYGSSLFAIDSTTFGVCYWDDGIHAGVEPAIRICTVTGVAITQSAANPILTADEYAELASSVYERAISFHAVHINGRIVVLRAGMSLVESGWDCLDGGYQVMLLWGDLAAGVITWEVKAPPDDTCGTGELRDVSWWVTVETYPSLEVYYGIYGISMNNNAAIFVYNSENDNTIYAVGVSGANEDYDVIDLTFGETGVGTTDFHIVGVTSTKAVFVARVADTNPSYRKIIGKVLTINSSTPVIAATADLLAPNNTGYDYVSVGIWDSDTALLCYEDTNFNDGCQGIAIIDVSAGISLDSNCMNFIRDWNYYAIGYDASNFMARAYDGVLTDGVIRTGITAADVETCNPFGSFRAFGGQIGRGAGNKVWITGHDGSNIELLEITLSTLVIADRVDLGAATEAEVDDETYIAWPFTMFGGEDNVYVFGRMNNPDGLGDPSHIIYTDDGGSSFSLLEGGFSSDTCGALFAWGMLIVAARNAGLGAKVYLWDGVDFNLKSTSLLNAGVKVKGMAVDHRDMTLVLCSNVADTVMVVGSVYPYVEWTDITSNHPNVSGVFAVQIL